MPFPGHTPSSGARCGMGRQTAVENGGDGNEDYEEEDLDDEADDDYVFAAVVGVGGLLDQGRSSCFSSSG